MPYLQLSSEKYYAEAVTLELNEIRRQKNRDAIQGFGNFLFTIVVLIGVSVALQTMATWLPAVTQLLEQYGLIGNQLPA